MTQLMALFMVSRKTVFNWFQAWERHKLIGLYNEPGRGRKPLFSPEQKAQIREWVKAEPRNLKKVLGQIQETWDISASLETIKRVLKSVGMSWRRIRKRVAGVPDAVEYATQVAALAGLKDLDAAGEIDLRYADEAGFSLVPLVPYAWQDKTDGIEVPSQRSPQLNVFGLLNRGNQFDAYTFVGSITAAVVIAVLDQFSQTRKQRTVVVLDRASIHTSQAVDAMRAEWAERQLEIFWLPAYSPQLNLIEILWRFIKYQWLEFSAYKDWDSLVEAVENILKEVGKKYVINFA